MTSMGVHKATISKHYIGRSFKFTVKADSETCYFNGKHVSSVAQVKTSTGPKIVFTVNNYYSAFMIYDLQKNEIVSSLKNPSG